MSWKFELGPSSATAVQLYPEHDYSKGERQIRDLHRTKSGKLYIYKWGDYKRFGFEVNYVPSSDAAFVNSWWDTNTELLLFITSDSTTEVHSVMIVNKESPLDRFNEPYNDYYRGEIALEEY